MAVEAFAEAGVGYEVGSVEFECVLGDVYFELRLVIIVHV